MNNLSIDFDYFSFRYNNVPPSPGSLLLSVPSLRDSIFTRSVVVLVEYNVNGSIGFVLNKPSEYRLCDLIDDIDLATMPVYIGGPVENDTLHFVHTLGFEIPRTIQLTDTLFWGGDFDYLRKIANTPRFSSKNFRFFMGYSGWGIDQLEDELEENAWVVHECDNDTIFSSDVEHLWQSTLQKMGAKYSVWANYTATPELN